MLPFALGEEQAKLLLDLSRVRRKEEQSNERDMEFHSLRLQWVPMAIQKLCGARSEYLGTLSWNEASPWLHVNPWVGVYLSETCVLTSPVTDISVFVQQPRLPVQSWRDTSSSRTPSHAKVFV